MNTPSPRKRLPVNPSLEHLQKQAKRRVKQNPALQLAAVQHQIAREYGYKNWAELGRVINRMARRHDLSVNGEKNYEPLPKVARYGSLEDIVKLLREGDFTQHDLDQALAHVLWYGGASRPWERRREMADLLLDHGADPDGQYGSGGAGPIVFGTAECVRPEELLYLIEAGADVSFPPVPTKYGLVCPLSAILGSYLRGENDRKHRYIDILLDHDAHIPPEVTPPILALHRGNAAQLGELLDHEPNLLTRRFPEMPFGNMRLRGATLLHGAVEFGEIECVETLLRRGADINLRADVVDGIGGQTPIFHAIATNCDGAFSTLQYLSQHVATQIDLSLRATWWRFGHAQTEPMTPLEFADHASRTEDLRWRTKVAEEAALLHSMLRRPSPLGDD